MMTYSILTRKKLQILDKVLYLTGLKLRVRSKNLIFLFLNQNIYLGYSKEPPQ